MIKNPPANAGDTDLIPGPGRTHMPGNNKVRAPQLLSLCSGDQQLQLLGSSRAPRAGAPQKKPVHRKENPAQPKRSKNLKDDAHKKKTSTGY